MPDSTISSDPSPDVTKPMLDPLRTLNGLNLMMNAIRRSRGSPQQLGYVQPSALFPADILGEDGQLIAAARETANRIATVVSKAVRIKTAKAWGGSNQNITLKVDELLQAVSDARGLLTPDDKNVPVPELAQRHLDAINAFENEFQQAETKKAAAQLRFRNALASYYLECKEFPAYEPLLRLMTCGHDEDDLIKVAENAHRLLRNLIKQYGEDAIPGDLKDDPFVRNHLKERAQSDSQGHKI